MGPIVQNYKTERCPGPIYRSEHCGSRRIVIGRPVCDRDTFPITLHLICSDAAATNSFHRCPSLILMFLFSCTVISVNMLTPHFYRKYAHPFSEGSLSKFFGRRCLVEGLVSAPAHPLPPPKNVSTPGLKKWQDSQIHILP